MTNGQECLLGKLYSENLELILGMEYQIIPFIQQDALDCQESIQYVVQDVQKEHTQSLWSADELLEELRESCRNFSQVSALFSQCLALAQLKA